MIDPDTQSQSHEYQVVWEQNGSTEWKPIDDLRCSSLIREYEQRVANETTRNNGASPVLTPGGADAVEDARVCQICSQLELPVDGLREIQPTTQICDLIAGQQTANARIGRQTTEAFLYELYAFLWADPSDVRRDHTISERSTPREIVKAILIALKHDR
eukprot:SAG11_NODE_2085_length_3847_cov_2.866329_4_plen_159_part_00